MDKVSMEVKISMDKEMEMFNLLLWESVEEWWDLKEIALKFQTKIITDQDRSSNMVEIILGLEMWVLWAASLHNMEWEVFRVPKEWTDHNKTILWCLNKLWDLLIWATLKVTKDLQIHKFSINSSLVYLNRVDQWEQLLLSIKWILSKVWIKCQAKEDKWWEKLEDLVDMEVQNHIKEDKEVLDQAQLIKILDQEQHKRDLQVQIQTA